MPTTIQTDECNDIFVDSNGNLAIANGNIAVAQGVKQAVHFWRGQWFINQTEGVPYLERVFVQPVTAGLAASVLADSIRAVSGVTSVDDIQAEIDPFTRKLTYNARITTQFGEDAISGAIN